VGSELDLIFSGIRKLCEEFGFSFAEAVTEAFFLFDDEFCEMPDSEIAEGIKVLLDKVNVQNS